MANSYFILTDSTSNRTCYFSVLMSGYNHIISKTTTANPTVEGELDVSVGGIFEKFIFTVRVRETEDRDGYGDKEDLEYFFRLNNPNGSPSNILTFTGHTGKSYHVVMMGEHNLQALGVVLEGNTAWFVVQCVFQILDEIVGS